MKALLGFVIKNFLAPIVFVVAFRFYGAKAAIGFALLVTLLQLAAYGVTKRKLSPFFLIASGFTVIFGIIDLLIANLRYFRLEPFLQNLLTGQVFLASLWVGRPIIGWFAHSLPEKFRPQIGPENERYFRRLTEVWVCYFLVKALVFLYLAFEVDLAVLVLCRTLVGGGSLALMIVGEIVYRKIFRKEPREDRRDPLAV